jgi:NAD+ synthetase
MPINIEDINTNYEEMWNNLVAGGVKYLEQYSNIKSFVIGLSGGIDSALTAVLARAVCDKLEETGRVVELHGYSLPIITNKQDELDRAEDAYVLCDHFTEVDLGEAYLRLAVEMDKSFFHEEPLPHPIAIQLGNIKARIRMMYLYNRAAKYRGIVLSTDNYTEYLLGFWTLHGDVGDFGFIQELWKTEVYGLAEWRGKRTSSDILLQAVAAKPTDGLGVSDSDLSQLLPDWKGSYRGGYECIDEILRAWTHGESYVVAGDFTLPLDAMTETHPVLIRHLATEFKRNNPANLSRNMILGVDYE